jgi:FAD/FMN-containing dehydrogenase
VELPIGCVLQGGTYKDRTAIGIDISKTGVEQSVQIGPQEPGAVQRRGEGGSRGARPVVSARPVLVRDLLDRWQHRHQRRRALLREVRRDDGPRPRTGRGAGGRRVDHARRQADQDVAGLSLLKLFVGSEGVLGVITRGILRLVPAQPPRATLVAMFATAQSAAEAVVELGLVARLSMVELMDNAPINIVEDARFSMGLDRTDGALLVIQSDAPGVAGAAEIAIAEIMELAISLGGTITGEHGIGRLKKPLLPTQLGPRVTEPTKQVKQLLDRTKSSTRARSSRPRRPAETSVVSGRVRPRGGPG